MSDPRGPEREILSKKLNLDSTVLTLSCGHKVKKNAIYTYNVGEMSHCIPCLDLSNRLYRITGVWEIKTKKEQL